VDQTLAPDGPNLARPCSVTPVFFGGSTRKVFHTTAPSLTRTAVTLPRKVQHGYAGSSARVSSHEAAGMKATSPCIAIDPVSRVASCSSTRLLQRAVPVLASTAYTQPFWSLNTSDVSAP